MSDPKEIAQSLSRREINTLRAICKNTELPMVDKIEQKLRQKLRKLGLITRGKDLTPWLPTELGNQVFDVLYPVKGQRFYD